MREVKNYDEEERAGLPCEGAQYEYAYLGERLASVSTLAFSECDMHMNAALTRRLWRVAVELQVRILLAGAAPNNLTCCYPLGYNCS